MYIKKLHSVYMKINQGTARICFLVGFFWVFLISQIEWSIYYQFHIIDKIYIGGKI